MTYPVNYGPLDGGSHTTGTRPNPGDVFIWRHPSYMLAYLYEFQGERWFFLAPLTWVQAREWSDCNGK